MIRTLVSNFRTCRRVSDIVEVIDYSFKKRLDICPTILQLLFVI